MGGSNVAGAKTEGAKGKVLGQRDDLHAPAHY